MRNDMDIRLARETDAAGLHRLNDLFNGDGTNTLEAIALSLKRNRQELVCVACDGEALVGFCCGQVFQSMCYAVRYAEVTELFVLEAYRRRGVGRRLVAWMETAFRERGINDFQLFTGRENHGAQAFYRSCGYVETEEMMFRKRPGEG